MIVVVAILLFDIGISMFILEDGQGWLSFFYILRNILAIEGIRDTSLTRWIVLFGYNQPFCIYKRRILQGEKRMRFCTKMVASNGTKIVP